MRTGAARRCALVAGRGLLGVAAVCAPFWASSGTAAEMPLAAGEYHKPAWLTDLSLAVREGYDDNAMLVSGEGAPKIDSLVTTVSPKAGVNLAPLLGGKGFFQTIGLGYAPDIVVYHDDSAESHTAHRFATTIKGKAGSFGFTLDNGFNYIDGDKSAPVYAAPDDTRSAFATAVPRERREQIQDRAKVGLQYDFEPWFVRPGASLIYYDLMTDQRAQAGYQNYADRHDVSGGADLGRKLSPKATVTLGYRFGRQYQEQFPSAVDPKHLSSSSDYQRALLGLEGKPVKWLTINLQGGPDFRSYDPNTPTHTTPVNDLHPVKRYGEASLSAALSKEDSLIFKYKQSQAVASTGKIPYFDSSYDLTYARVVTKKLGLTLGARLQDWDYTSGNLSTSLRNDLQISLTAGLRYNFNGHVSAELNYVRNMGRNAQDKIANEQFREFDQSLVSVGVLIKL